MISKVMNVVKEKKWIITLTLGMTLSLNVNFNFIINASFSIDFKILLVVFSGYQIIKQLTKSITLK